MSRLPSALVAGPHCLLASGVRGTRAGGIRDTAHERPDRCRRRPVQDRPVRPRPQGTKGRSAASSEPEQRSVPPGRGQRDVSVQGRE